MQARLYLLLLPLFILSCTQPPVQDQLVISVSYDPNSLDPHASNTISNFAVSCNFYEPLVRSDRTMSIQPALAASWENPDSLTWIFHLQKGVRFHSGKLMDSSDVVYSFQRVLDHPELEMRSYLVHVARVEPLGPYQVRIVTQKPLSNLLNKLYFIAIVPAGSQSETLRDHVNGTGPFRLEKWTNGGTLSMVRNDRYWGQKSPFHKCTYLLNRSTQQTLEDLRTGKAQMVRSNTRDLEKIVRTLPDFDLLIHDSVFVKYLAFDMFRDTTPYCDSKVNPFKNKIVRQALRLAIHNQEIAEKLPSYAVALNQPVPPFVFGYNPQIPVPEFNPEKAHQLLAEAGFPDGFSVTLHARNIFPEAVAIVQEQLARIGINIRPILLSSGDFYERLTRRDTSLYLTGFGAPTGDASNVLDLAMHSRNDDAQLGDANWGGYFNPQVDSEIESSVSILEPERRRKAFQKILATVMDDLPWIPLYIDQDAYAVSKTLDWEPRYDSYVIASEVRLRTRARKK